MAYVFKYVNITDTSVVILVSICYRTQAFVLFFQHTAYNAQKKSAVEHTTFPTALSFSGLNIFKIL